MSNSLNKEKQYRVFVVDDDRNYAKLMTYRIEKGHDDVDLSVFHSGEDALSSLSDKPDLVLLDIMMPGMGGAATLEKIRELAPDTQVVMVSAQGIFDVAIDAMRNGAHDYITKGMDDMVKVNKVINQVKERVDLRREVEKLRSEVALKYGMNELAGDSPAMEEVYMLIQKALRGDLTVAIQGESGTGKELVARAIHYNSSRRRGPFVVVNCAAIPRELMESEFFGHEKGSFTGAHARKIGKFEQADRGTLFLDEIGELDLGLQAKLLRALQNREITRVGGNELISFDARIISATNRDIKAMIPENQFREDLYYRLFDFPIPLPPLRERANDPNLLAQFFLRRYISKDPEFKGKKLSSEARQAIHEYPWPGNVRELKSAIERAILLSDNDEIQAHDLMLNRVDGIITDWKQRGQYNALEKTEMPPAMPASPTPRVASPEASESPIEIITDNAGTFRPPMIVDSSESDVDMRTLEEIKKNAVIDAFNRAGGSVDQAALQLGIGRATMYRLLKKYELMEG